MVQVVLLLILEEVGEETYPVAVDSVLEVVALGVVIDHTGLRVQIAVVTEHQFQQELFISRKVLLEHVFTQIEQIHQHHFLVLASIVRFIQLTVLLKY